MHVTRSLAGGLVLAAAFGATAAPAGAATAPAFAISPANRAPYFILSLAPGTTVHRTVRVTNVGDRPGQVRLAGVDATTGATSGAVYLSPTAPRHAVGSWLTLSSPALTLAPHRSALVGFTVTVPAGAASGAHLGGLVAAPVQPVATHTTRRGHHAFRVQVNEVSVVGVEVRLPGPQTPMMSIGTVKASGRPGYQTLVVGLANTGDTLVKGHGRIVVRSAAGRTVVTQGFALDTFVPRTHIDYPVYLKRRLPAGRYRAAVQIDYDGRHATAAHSFAIGARELRQTYGSTVPSSLGSAAAGSSTPVGLIVGGAVALLLLSVGGTALYFRSRLRAAQAGRRD